MDHRFDVAFSFAGPHRDKVKAIAELVAAQLGRERVFYDDWFEYEILGPDMDVLLQRVYHEKSLMVVAEVSDAYSGRPWCQAEARAIRSLRNGIDSARDETARLRVLDAQFGTGSTPGVFSTTGVLDGMTKTSAQCAEIILKRRALLIERLSRYTNPSLIEQLKSNRDLFSNRKMLVMGDIALDRTFKCGPPKIVHAIHANGTPEKQFDIEPDKDGDDHGTVGSSNNHCILFNTFRATSTLITTVGKNPEGERVLEELLKQKNSSGGLFDFRPIELDGVETITRLRFLTFNHNNDRYELSYRFNKEPDCAASISGVERDIATSSFQDWLRIELRTTDAIVLNDCEKGVFSPQVIQVLAKAVREENSDREGGGRIMRQPIVTLVDPKSNWDVFVDFPVSVMKSNQREACLALGIGETQIAAMHFHDATKIAERLHRRFGSNFKNIVTTWGPNGAIWLTVDSFGRGEVYRFRPARVGHSGYYMSTHCGDIFGAAIVLALLAGKNLFEAIPFANYCGALQFTKAAGTKPSLNDIVNPHNIEDLGLPNLRDEKLADFAP